MSSDNSTFDPYANEAKELWGDTAAYQDSQKRLKGYSKEEVARAGAAMQAATNKIIDAMKAGLPADSIQAMEGAEAHRQSITDWWYECSYEIHKGLASMYLADPRFSAHYEGQHAGLAKYIHDAIIANAARHL